MYLALQLQIHNNHPSDTNLNIFDSANAESHSSVHLADTQPLREAIDAECMLTNLEKRGVKNSQLLKAVSRKFQ